MQCTLHNKDPYGLFVIVRKFRQLKFEKKITIIINPLIVHLGYYLSLEILILCKTAYVNSIFRCIF